MSTARSKKRQAKKRRVCRFCNINFDAKGLNALEMSLQQRGPEGETKELPKRYICVACLASIIQAIKRAEHDGTLAKLFAGKMVVPQRRIIVPGEDRALPPLPPFPGKKEN